MRAGFAVDVSSIARSVRIGCGIDISAGFDSLGFLTSGVESRATPMHGR